MLPCNGMERLGRRMQKGGDTLAEALLPDRQAACPHLPARGNRKRQLPLTALPLDAAGEGTGKSFQGGGRKR